MRVAIFTPRCISPLHPRLVVYKDFFDNHRIPVSFYNFNDKAGETPSFRNWLTLWFFDWIAVAHAEKRIDAYDVVIVNDLKYLPLVRLAKKKGKRVIYETIDHNVYLRFYQLSTRFRAFKLLYLPITQFFCAIEKWYAHRFCDAIVVNSDALLNYFSGRATLLYYSSPLENLQLNNNSNYQPALLYLGAFTIDKGASLIVEMSSTLKLPLFVFGDIPEPVVLEMVRHQKQVVYQVKLSTIELERSLKQLMDSYFLIGVNVTEPVHQSYAVQEANKDIDYLALGIPILGNYRLPTKEKIDLGCGWYSDDTHLSEKIARLDQRQAKSSACLDLYNRKYSRVLFNKILRTCWENVNAKVSF